MADALGALAEIWRGGAKFPASDLARLLNDRTDYRSDDDRERAGVIREFLFPKLSADHDVSPRSVGKAIKRHVGEPVKMGDRILTLKEWRDPHSGPKGALRYFVQAGQ